MAGSAEQKGKAMNFTRPWTGVPNIEHHTPDIDWFFAPPKHQPRGRYSYTVVTEVALLPPRENLYDRLEELMDALDMEAYFTDQSPQASFLIPIGP